MSNHPDRIRRFSGGLSLVRGSLVLAGVGATTACLVGDPASDDTTDAAFAHTLVDLRGSRPQDVGSGPKEPPKTSSVNCPAQFSPVISGGEIRDLNATAATTGCAQTFCTTRTLPNGGTGYTPVSGNLLSADFPIPRGAITSGCPAVPAATVCPTKMSNGKAAAGCAATTADNNCETITLCPDPGGFEDPNDPETKRKLQNGSLSDIRNLIPNGMTQSIPGTINTALSRLSPLYVNPCEWDLVLDGATYGFDIEGKAGQSAACVSDADCTSGRCSKSTQPNTFYGGCVTGPSTTAFEREEGGSAFGVKLRGGLNSGKAQIRRAFFYPSTSFTAESTAALTATARIFGIRVNLMTTNLKSKLTECKFDFSWTNSSDGDDFASIGALVLDGLESVGVTVESSSTATRSATPSALESACDSALTALRSAERTANERMHDALIASSFFNLTGGGGRVVTNRAAAQRFIDNYRTAVASYRTALSTFDTAQQRALDHSIAAELFDFQVGLSLPFVKTYGIGPFSVGVEMGVFGRVGVQDVRLKSEADTHFTHSTATPCTGNECMRVQASAGMMPHVAAGAYAYVGGGFDLGLVGGSIKVRGELDLINVKMPMAGSFAIERTKRNVSTVLPTVPSLPAPFRAFNTITQIAPAAFELTPDVAQYNAPVLLGGKLSPLEGVEPNTSFLSGRVELIAEAKLFLVGKKRWRKTLFDWKGFDQVWNINTPQGLPAFAQADLADAMTQRVLTAAGNPLFAHLDFVPVPNMALMPKMALLATPGTANPTTTATAVQSALDTKAVPSSLDFYFAHHESDLGKPWTDRTAGGRCSFLPRIR